MLPNWGRWPFSVFQKVVFLRYVGDRSNDNVGANLSSKTSRVEEYDSKNTGALTLSWRLQLLIRPLLCRLRFVCAPGIWKVLRTLGADGGTNLAEVSMGEWCGMLFMLSMLWKTLHYFTLRHAVL